MEVEDLGHHISRRFNEDLERVRNSVLAMGGLVEEQLDRAIKALSEGDSALGLQVAEDDQKVNRMEVSIDEECSRILATRAPTAGDLRLVIAIIKTITDLEAINRDALAREARAMRIRGESPGSIGFGGMIGRGVSPRTFVEQRLASVQRQLDGKSDGTIPSGFPGGGGRGGGGFPGQGRGRGN